MIMIRWILSIFFFQSQTLLEKQNAVLPDLHIDTTEPKLSHIVVLMKRSVRNVACQ